MSDKKTIRHQPFPQELWENIEGQIQNIKKEFAHPVAAFDVDGTLWDGDISEHFFDYQILHRLLPDLPRDPWAHYISLMMENEESALIWLAQINKGQKLETVRKWTRENFMGLSESTSFFGEQKKFIRMLLQENFSVYFISGSVQWVVEPLAEHFGVPADNVIGMRTEVVDGIITENPVLPLTWKEGKIRALLKKTNGTYPQICSGNSMGDFALLDSATHLRLAVSSQPRNGRLVTSEKMLQREARKKGWLTHSFA